MEPDLDVIFSGSDYSHFLEWLNLDRFNLTWQGKFEKEFDFFWDLFFTEGLSLGQLAKRFDYSLNRIKSGPLSAWFSWLKEKFYFYSFVYKDVSIQQLSSQSGLRIPELSLLLRNQFLDLFPHLDEEFNTIFSMGNVSSKNIFITFDHVTKSTGVTTKDCTSGDEDEIMRSLEVTLFPEWERFLKLFEKEMFNPKVDWIKLKEQASLFRYLGFFKEVFILFVLGGALLFSFIKLNKYFEKNLATQITLYQPEFSWLNKALTFKEEQGGADEQTVDLQKELNKIDLELDKKVDDKVALEEERFGPESEVRLTSLDALPQELTESDLELGEYEELKRKNMAFRDSLFGNRKVYRVLLRSVDLRDTSLDLAPILGKYQAEQVDQVKPGTSVPGGIYYNLFVPRENLKSFLSKVLEVGEGTLYESRTKWGNVPGKNKVLIWVKEI